MIKINKEDFKEWMNSQIKSDGKNYSPKTINSYCSALNSKPQMLVGIEDKYKVSIFSSAKSSSVIIIPHNLYLLQITCATLSSPNNKIPLQ